MGFPAANNLNSPDASLIGRIAALEKRVSAASSGVPIGKVVFQSTTTPTWSGDISITSANQVSASIPIPTFATSFAAIYYGYGSGHYNTGSGASTDTDYLHVAASLQIGGTVISSVSIFNEALSGWWVNPSVVKSLMSTIPTGASTITLSASMHTDTHTWTDDTYNKLWAGALVLFQY